MHIHHILTNWPAGGVGAVVLQLVDDLQKEGHSCSFTLLSEPVSPFPYDYYLFPYIFPNSYSALTYLEFATFPSKQLSKSDIKNWKVYLNNIKIDILHFHTLPRELRLSLCIQSIRVPMVYTDHSTRLELKMYPKLQLKCMQLAYRKFYSKVNCVAVSNSVEYYQTLFRLRNPKRKHSTILNSIDISKFPNRVFKQNSPLRAVYVARICPKKGHHVLIQAWQKVVQHIPIHLDLVGEIEYNFLDQEYINSLGLQEFVHLHGNQSSVKEFLYQADFCVFPSEKEGLSIALLEAMAAALPVIMTNIPELTQIAIPNEMGLSFEKGNPEALAEAVLKLTSNSNRIHEMGFAARQHVEHNFSHNIGKEYLQFYQSIL